VVQLCREGARLWRTMESSHQSAEPHMLYGPDPNPVKREAAGDTDGAVPLGLLVTGILEGQYGAS
jgi:hypothetical protein